MNTRKHVVLTSKQINTISLYQMMAARGATVDEIAVRYNISTDRVRRALETVLPPSEKDLTAEPLQATATEKLDAHRRRLEREFDWMVRQKVIAECDKYKAQMDKAWKERLGAIERLLNQRKGAFTRAEFNKILTVVHPDTGSHATDAQRAEAFRLLNDRKVLLLDEKEHPVTPVVHDLVAQREARRAEQQAKRRKA